MWHMSCLGKLPLLGEVCIISFLLLPPILLFNLVVLLEAEAEEDMVAVPRRLQPQ